MRLILSTVNESTKRISLLQDKIDLFKREVQKWYKHSGRDFLWRQSNLSSYEIIISELLLWRTRAENVAKVYKKFLEKFPDWETLREVSEEELRTFLQPLGYIERASILIELAKILSEIQVNHLNRDDLQSLPGIGQYIANAILTICQDMKEPLLDVNMARVLERFFGPRQLADIRFDPYLQQLARLVLPEENIKEFNWAILDFAAVICRVKPKCNQCPLQNSCLYASITSSIGSDC